MNVTVTNYVELIHAIHNANLHPHEPFVIELAESNEEYVLRDYVDGGFYGKNGLPVVTSNITINGNGRTISRADDAVPFRLFGVNTTSWHRNHVVRLVLNDLTLRNGKSWVDGGGAMLNNGEVMLNNCVFEDNVGTHGGAIYNGDAHPLAAKNCVFRNNTGLLEGGAIYNANLAQLGLEECAFENNRVIKGQSVDIYVFSTVKPLRFMGDGKATATVSMNGTVLSAEDVQTLHRFAQTNPPAVLTPPHKRAIPLIEDGYEDDYDIDDERS